MKKKYRHKKNESKMKMRRLSSHPCF